MTNNVYAVMPELGIQLYKNGIAITEDKYYIVEEDNDYVICDKGFCTIWGGSQVITVYFTEKDLPNDKYIPDNIDKNLKVGILSLSYENGGLDYDSEKNTGFIPYEEMGYYLIFDLEKGSVTPSLIPYSSTNDIDYKNYKNYKNNTYLIVAFCLFLIALFFLFKNFKKLLNYKKI